MKIRTLVAAAAISVSGFALLPSAQAADGCDVLVFSGRPVEGAGLVNAGAAGCSADADTRVLTPGATHARVGVLVSASPDKPTGGSFTQAGVTTTFEYVANAAGTRWESPTFDLTEGDVTATATVGSDVIEVHYADLV